MGFGKIRIKEFSHVEVDAFIFKIVVGSILEAVVNQTSNNHVSCLVRNVLNVSIIKPEDQSYDQWLGSQIKKDDQILVRVLSNDLTKKGPRAIAEIVDKNDKFVELKNKQENHSLQCPEKKYASHFIKSSKLGKEKFTSVSKHSSSNSESSFETTTHFQKYGDTSNKISPLFSQTTINNRNENIKSELFSSTPTFMNNYECDLSALSASNNYNSDSTNINMGNKIASLQNDSSISEDVHKRIQSTIQKFFSTPVKFKINQNSPESIEKNKNPNKIKSKSIEHNSSERERNTVNYDLITSPLKKTKKKKKFKNSKILKSPKHSELSPNFMKINNKDELIRLILEEYSMSSSDDNLKCTSPKNNFTDILYKQMYQKVSTKNPISNVFKSKKNTNAIINKDISDSLFSENSTSSEDKELITKSNNIDHYSKKKNTTVENEKYNLIKLILTSVKNENKKHKKSLLINSNSSEDSNKLTKVKHVINNDKSKQYNVPIKNKKESNTLIQNVSQQCNQSHYKMKSSADDSTDDAIEFTKKKIDSQNLSKNNNVSVPELAIKNKNCKQFIKKRKTMKNMDELAKIQNASRIKIDKVVSKNIIKRKSLKTSKNILIKRLLNSIQNSSS